MSGAILHIVVVIAAGELNDPTLAGAESALRASLPDNSIVTREVERGDSFAANGDDAVRVAQAQASALTAIARLRWSEHHRHVVLHLYRREQNSWIDREIVFDEKDALRERGRAVGFALLSMMPDEIAESRTINAITQTDPAIAPPDRGFQVPYEIPSKTNPFRPHWAIEATAHGAFSTDGYGGGFGGRLTGRRYLTSSFSLVLALRGRAFGVAPAEANATSLALGLGVAWETAPTTHWGIGAQALGLVIRDALTHQSADDPAPVTHARFVPGADLRVEGLYRIAPQAALLVGVGGELTFGETDVFLHQRRVAEVSAFRAYFESGVRVSF